MIIDNYTRLLANEADRGLSAAVDEIVYGRWEEVGDGESGPLLFQEGPSLTDWLEVVCSIGDRLGWLRGRTTRTRRRAELDAELAAGLEGATERLVLLEAERRLLAAELEGCLR